MKRSHALFAILATFASSAAAFAQAASDAADGPVDHPINEAAKAIDALPEMKPFLEGLWDFLGACHPAIVHFPIGLTLGAAMFIVARLVFRKIPIEVPYYTLLVGALFSIPAVIFGLAYAEGLGMGGAFSAKAFDTSASAFWHRWGGVGVCLLAIVVAIVAAKSMSKPEKGQMGWQVLVLITAAVMGWVGSEGGELTYGSDHYSKQWEKPVVKVIEIEAPAEDGKIDFVKHIQPIFEATCIHCHGPEEDKGGYRMHTKEAFFKGGSLAEDEPGSWPDGMTTVVHGKPAESYLVYVLKPEFEDELMPPEKEGGPLSDEQIDLIKQWVEQGAEWPDGVVLEDKSK